MILRNVRKNIGEWLLGLVLLYYNQPMARFFNLKPDNSQSGHICGSTIPTLRVKLHGSYKGALLR